MKWKINGNGISTDEPVISQKHICFFPKDYNVSEEHKHLLATSPEMFDELKSIHKEIHEFNEECAEKEHTDTGEVWEMLERFATDINVIINKAKGE